MKSAFTIYFKVISIFFSILFIISTQIFGADLIKKYLNDSSENSRVNRRIRNSIELDSNRNCRFAEINWEMLLNADSFELELFAGVNLQFNRTKIEKRDQSNFSWFGNIEGIKTNQIVLSVNSGDVSGNIWFQEFYIQIRPKGNGVHSICQINRENIPKSAHPKTPDLSKQQDTRTRSGPREVESSGAVIRALDDGSTIDIMVVYTRDAAVLSGNISSEIQLAIDTTNLCYSNSQVTQRLNLVKMLQVDYNETGDAETDLNNITYSNDAYLNEVHTVRDAYGADVISFLVAKMNDYAGLGWVLTSLSTSFSSHAFNIVQVQYASSTIPHELGHNMGAQHDLFVHPKNGSEINTYCFGYVNHTKRFQTVMAYYNDCRDKGYTCDAIPYFSNPSVTYNGGVTGDATDADVARTLNETALTVSRFRDSVNISDVVGEDTEIWNICFISTISGFTNKKERS